MPYHRLSNVNCSLCKGPCLLLFFLGIFGTPFYSEGTKGNVMYGLYRIVIHDLFSYYVDALVEIQFHCY